MTGRTLLHAGGTGCHAIFTLILHRRPLMQMTLDLSKLLVVTTDCKYINVVTIKLIDYSIPL
jgi:hypothetical protein